MTAHNQAAGTNAETYVITPCQSAEIETAGYSIPVPLQFPDAGPNSIHVIHGKDEYFRTAWDGRSDIVLDSTRLRNIQGSTRFHGFVAGDSYVLGYRAR